MWEDFNWDSFLLSFKAFFVVKILALIFADSVEKLKENVRQRIISSQTVKIRWKKNVNQTSTGPTEWFTPKKVYKMKTKAQNNSWSVLVTYHEFYSEPQCFLNHECENGG